MKSVRVPVRSWALLPGARAAGSREGSLTLSAVLSSDVRPEVVTKPGKDRAVGGALPGAVGKAVGREANRLSCLLGGEGFEVGPISRAHGD